MTEVHFYKPDLQANTFTPSYNAAMTIHQDGRITLNENERLRGHLASIIADPDCCAASKAVARAALGDTQ